MALNVKCPGCQQTLKIPDSAQGKKVKCPKCAKVLAISPAKAKSVAAPGGETISAGNGSALVLPSASQLAARRVNPQPGGAATLQGPTKSVIQCPACQRSLKIASNLAGKKIKCPQCQSAFQVPTRKAGSAISLKLPVEKASQPKPASPAADVQPKAAPAVSFDEVAAVDESSFAGDSDGFDFGDTAFGGMEVNGISDGDPFAGLDFNGDLAGNNLATNRLGAATGFGNAAAMPAPIGQPQFARPQAATKEAAPVAGKRSKSDDIILKGLVYRMPALLGIGCAVLNLIIVVTAAGIGCVTWFPMIRAIGLILFIAGSTIGAQVYAINGFIGILNMADREGGIHAAKGILACPFIAAIVIAIALGPFGIFLAAGIWIFMLLYNWPLGWWLWLMLEKKEAAEDFDEVDYNNVDVSSLMAGKSKEAAKPQPVVWSPVGVAAPAAEEVKPAASRMSPETKLKLMLAGGAVAALLLVGGVVTMGVMAVAGSGDEADAAPPPPDGWHLATATGVSMHFPSEPMEPELGVGGMECWTTYSDKTESFFLLAASPSGSPLSVDGLMKNTARRLGGDVLGHREFSRGPCKGMAGQLSVSFKFPDMPVEAYQHEGRTVIIGYVAGSTLRSRGGDNSIRAVSPAEEAQERDTFYDSLHFAKRGFFGY